MKLKLILAAIGVIIGLLTSCASSSDPTFMANASAAINGGIIESPSGAAMSPGLQNKNRPHPFFGAPQ